MGTTKHRTQPLCPYPTLYPTMVTDLKAKRQVKPGIFIISIGEGIGQGVGKGISSYPRLMFELSCNIMRVWNCATKMNEKITRY